MKIEAGLDGNLYLVFFSEDEADQYNEWLSREVGHEFAGACFGKYMNALRITDLQELLV